MSEVYLIFTSPEIDSEGRPVGHLSLFGIYARPEDADIDAEHLRERGAWAGVVYGPVRQ